MHSRETAMRCMQEKPNFGLFLGFRSNLGLRFVLLLFLSAENKWELIDAKGDSPGCLQEHSMVGYKDSLYVFGGEVGFSNGVETPLWTYNISVSFFVRD